MIKLRDLISETVSDRVLRLSKDGASKQFLKDFDRVFKKKSKEFGYGKLKLHHYSDKDYKEILFLKEKKEISKECIKHSKVEVISYKTFNHTDGTKKRNYKVGEKK